MDVKTGSVSPVRHSISDLAHQLHLSDLVVSVDLAIAEFTDLLKTWREVQAEKAAGKALDMRKQWHPLYVDETAWAP